MNDLYFNLILNYKSSNEKHIITENDVLPPDNNQINIRLNEQQLDGIMNMDEFKFNKNVIKSNNGFVGLKISNLLDSEYVIQNQNDLSYATSIVIELPEGQETTPIDVNGIKVTNLSDGKSAYFDFENEKVWSAIPNNKIFKGKKRLTNGQLKNVDIGEIDIPANETICVFKSSSDNPDEYELCTINNNSTEPATVIFELPDSSNIMLKGWKNWIKNIYHGVMFVGNLAKYIEPVGGVLGVVAATVSTVTKSIDAVAGPFINILDEKSISLKNRSSTKTKFIYDRNPLLKELKESTTYEISDSQMASINSNFFDPINENYDNNTMKL